MSRIKFTTINEYIASFPNDIQPILEKIRLATHQTAPNATEAISYQMPTFKLNGNLVHFAGYKKHIGFYPTPSAIIKFNKELKGYKTTKGAIQFPLNQPIPFNLIRKIVLFRVKESLNKATKTDLKMLKKGLK